MSKDPAMLFSAIIGFGNNSVATFYLSNHNSVSDKSAVEPEQERNNYSSVISVSSKFNCNNLTI